LSILLMHLNEPDPLRGAIVDKLEELPQNIWQQSHLDSLAQIIHAVVNAFDTSSFTVGALSLLMVKLFAYAPEWSATQFASIVQAHGLTFTYKGVDRFSDADVRRFAPALRPILLSWAENKNETALNDALSLLGKRVHVFDELLDALELLLHRGTSFEFGNTILSNLIKYRPARTAQLIPELLQGDRNWITYPAVSTYLFQQRQDLLTPFLGQRKYSKLFNDPRSTNFRRQWREHAPLTRGFARWTSRQQTIFAHTLLKEIHDETNDQQTIIRAITQLTALPAIPAKHLITLTNSQRPIVRDAAMIHLSRLDTSQGIPLLLKALHDQRAVRAIYALRPFLLTIPVQQALAILRTIPFTKVTVAKEKVRLLGELPGEEAYQELLALDAQELHRDVRVALLRALWFHLERDETWHILEREARSTDIILALSTVRMSIDYEKAKEYRVRERIRRRRQRSLYAMSSFSWLAEWNPLTMASLSGEYLSPKAQQRLMLLFASLLDRPEIEVRASVLRDCTRLAGADEGQRLLSRLLEALHSDNEDICTAASKAIFGTCVADDAPLIAQAVERLLPHRRALQTALQVLQEALFAQKRQLLPAIRAILDTLATDPVTIKLRIDLAIALLPWDEIAALLEMAVTREELHAGALNQVCNKLHTIIDRYTRTRRSDVKNMLYLEKRLSASHDERLRRIALAALITQSNLPEGWNEEQRARLQIYRADPSVLVRATAQFTFPPVKEE
jgi:hypothetical protein